MKHHNAERGNWGSKLAFILAAAGSAIGLGNIWRFPYVTYDNGGGKFVLVNLLCVLVVGLPVLIGEMLVGRATQKSTVASLEKLSGKFSAWRWMGFLGVGAAFIIMSFYCTVSGWVLYYVYLSLSGAFHGLGSEGIADLFGAVAVNPGLNLICSTAFLVMCLMIVLGGVEKGIEKYSKLLMPALLLLLFILLITCIFLPNDGFINAFKFMFNPTTELKGSAVLEALGNAFFSLSLGMGAMLTYGSYLRKDTDLVNAAMWVVILDTAIAFMACIIIFSIVFAYGGKVGQTSGLVFQALPLQFSKMYGGYFISIAFFVLLFFAALTSAISLLEVATAFLVDWGWNRKKACLFMSAGIWIFGLPSALSSSEMWKSWMEWLFPAKGLPENLQGENIPMLFGNQNFFDMMDKLSANWMLPIGGLLISIYVGFVLKDKLRKDEFKAGLNLPVKLYEIWLFSVRFIAPVVIIFVMFNKINLISTATINQWFEAVFGKPETKIVVPVKKPAS
jgi:NSS family neurotransmitter:Na+ symporter